MIYFSMNDLITCPHCKKTFSPDDVFTHQLDAKRKEMEEKAEIELKAYKSEYAAKKEEELRKKIQQEQEIKLKDSENEIKELRERTRIQQEEQLEANRKQRQLQQQLEEKSLEMEKKLQQEEEKIRQETRQKAEEEYRLKNLEKDRVILEQSKALEDMKRKLEQGSQQVQGEVLEEYLESSLRTAFINDTIDPVPKGIRGADVIQIVCNNFGKRAGSVIWESKRTKVWSGDWVAKLKADKRAVNADAAIIVSQVMPEGVKNFGYYQGVWVCNYESIIGAATSVRTLLLSVAAAKSSTNNTVEKKDALFEYIQSTEFKNRVEAISEAFKSRQEEIDIEKRWFTKKWAREEKTIRGLIDTNQVLRGELEAIIGKDMTSDRILEIPENNL